MLDRTTAHYKNECGDHTITASKRNLEIYTMSKQLGVTFRGYRHLEYGISNLIIDIG